MKIKNNKAFTLVELIVVITILAILGTIAFLSLQGYSKNARDSVRTSDLDALKTNLGIFQTQKGIYPNPDNGTDITYTGSVVWSQGTIGENVVKNLGKLNKKPTDPLYNTEYTYSVTSSKLEYQIGTINESSPTAYNKKILISNKANADGETARVMGNYNEKMIKVSSGSIDYILALPGIMLANTGTTILSTGSLNSLVYYGLTNLPNSYKSANITMTGYTYTQPILEVWSGSLSNLGSSDTEKIKLITNLKTAYSGSSVKGKSMYSEILNADTSNTGTITSIAGNYIQTSLGVKINNVVINNNTIISTSNCSISQIGYNCPINPTNGCYCNGGTYISNGNFVIAKTMPLGIYLYSGVSGACNSYNSYGYGNWRAPNITELMYMAQQDFSFKEEHYDPRFQCGGFKSSTDGQGGDLTAYSTSGSSTWAGCSSPYPPAWSSCSITWACGGWGGNINSTKQAIMCIRNK